MLKKTFPMRGFRSSFLFWLAAILPARADVPVVKTADLAKISSDAYGLTVPRDKTMWLNTDFSTAKRLIKEMKPVSPTATDLQKDILLSTALPPAFTPPNEWLTVRMGKLFDWGLFGEVVQLGEKIPQNARTARQNEIIVNALLLTDFQRACAYPAENMEKIRLICEALNGNEDEAFRLADILREQTHDAFVLNAAEAFLARSPFAQIPDKATPLNIAVARLAGIDFSPSVSAESPLWLQKALVETVGVPAEKKVPVAEKLTEKGLFSPDALRVLYDESGILTGDLKTDFENAKRRGVSTAFALAMRDKWGAETPDMEKLADSAWRIKGFMAADMPEKAVFWLDKAEALFPDSDTVENGWAYAELRPKKDRFFLFRMEQMIRHDEPAEKLDAVMAVFLALDLMSYEENWHLSTRALPEALKTHGGSAERLLQILAAMNDRPDGLLRGLGALKKEGFEKEALRIAVETDVLP